MTLVPGGRTKWSELDDWLATITLDVPDCEVAVLRGVIDESGTHLNARALCVAACVGTSTQWAKLRKAWDPEVIGALGAVEKYHAKDAACGDLNFLLAELIVQHMDYAIVSVIRESEFKAVVPQDIRSFFGSAYKIGVDACLSYTSLHFHKQKKIAWVIEAGHKNEAAVREYLNGVLVRPVSMKDYGVQSVTWVDKRNPLIHPADLLAHETATCVDGPLTRVFNILVRRSLIVDLTQEQLAGFASDAVEARATIKRFRRQNKQ